MALNPSCTIKFTEGAFGILHFCIGPQNNLDWILASIFKMHQRLLSVSHERGTGNGFTLPS